MDNKDNSFFGNIYNDFFNSNLTKNNNDKIDKKLAELTEELRKLNVDPNVGQEESISDIVQRKKDEGISAEKKPEKSKEDKDKKIEDLYNRIDELYITDESKEVLKKMMAYARKYNEKLIKNYLAFDMKIYSDNKEITQSIVEIVADGLNYFDYVQGNKVYESSFFQMDLDGMSRLYKSNNNFLILRDVDGITTLKDYARENFLKSWEEMLNSETDKRLTILVDKDKEKIENAFAAYPTIKDRIFDFEIQTINPDSQDIYNDLLEELKKDYETTEEFDVKLLDYIIATYPKTNLTYPEYRNSVYEKILFDKTDEKVTESCIPKYEKDKTIDEIFAELNELVGLQNVKDALKDLVSLMQFKEKAQDVKIKDTNLHMVFLGNPGTGKTTVARMIAGILYNLKYVKQNKLIEVSAKDLVGEYVGQTAPKTMAVVEKAMGGVLFIDEAYSLASKPGENNSFNEECVATLIQAMENYRDKLVVIFAGYSKEMQDFLNTNSGIVSRIGYTLEFEDYKVDELISIFTSMVTKAGFTISDDAINKARKVIEEYKDTENFGNARFVRNLYEKTIIKHASNCKDIKSKKSLKNITAKDISTENLLKM